MLFDKRTIIGCFTGSHCRCWRAFCECAAFTTALLLIVQTSTHAGGRVINVSSSLGQLGPDNAKYGGMPSKAYRVAIAGAATLQQLRDLRFDSADKGMRAATRSQYPCPAYRATKAMLNKVWSCQLHHQPLRDCSRNLLTLKRHSASEM